MQLADGTKIAERWEPTYQIFCNPPLDGNDGMLKSLIEELSRAEQERNGLRRRVHFLERHNQWFERCESAWCNPSEDNNPAIGYVPGHRKDSEPPYEDFQKEIALLNESRDRLRDALAEAKSLLRRFNNRHTTCTIKYGYGPRPVDSRCALCKEYDAMVDRDVAAIAAEKGREG